MFQLKPGNILYGRAESEAQWDKILHLLCVSLPSLAPAYIKEHLMLLIVVYETGNHSNSTTNVSIINYMYMVCI